MPTGVGAAAVGLSIAGYGGVDSAPVPQQVILIDAHDGVAREARKVDPVSGQYVLNNAGAVQGMGGVQQLVLMRAKTVLNSSAVRGLGLAPPGGVITATTLADLKKGLLLAMKDIIDAKLVEVVDVFVERLPSGKVLRYFLWRDLTASGGHGGTERTEF